MKKFVYLVMLAAFAFVVGCNKEGTETKTDTKTTTSTTTNK